MASAAQGSLETLNLLHLADEMQLEIIAHLELPDRWTLKRVNKHFFDFKELHAPSDFFNPSMREHEDIQKDIWLQLVRPAHPTWEPCYGCEQYMPLIYFRTIYTTMSMKYLSMPQLRSFSEQSKTCIYCEAKLGKLAPGKEFAASTCEPDSPAKWDRRWAINGSEHWISCSNCLNRRSKVWQNQEQGMQLLQGYYINGNNNWISCNGNTAWLSLVLSDTWSMGPMIEKATFEDHSQV
ncbi:hypothetical protein K402DRAFT_61015 [Aulographum hederae CBS 113979]|uniref:F-box domain-containing protein n=1 Tax=Aulographum hederae CBS 113979 TaxID=1176131 RepID=A0A6G1H1C1_9PEZI|nr:hypothetical protein K402DRAFT_61015 [Aulographum hederae CBS 113979]